MDRYIDNSGERECTRERRITGLLPAVILPVDPNPLDSLVVAVIPGFDENCPCTGRNDELAIRAPLTISKVIAEIDPAARRLRRDNRNDRSRRVEHVMRDRARAGPRPHWAS